MSDLESAAASLKVPEAILQRSAAARATAAGSSTDDVLAAWAGGDAAPSSPADASGGQVPATDSPDVETAPAAATGPDPATGSGDSETGVAPQELATQEQAPEQQEAASQPIAEGPSTPPILESERQNPFLAMAGAAAVFALAIVAGLVVPSIPEPGNGVYSSAVPMTQNAIDGKQIYFSVGCASCHTQMVRPIAADAGLGGITVSDTNQVLGVRRLGPDLAHVSSRVEDPTSFGQILTADPEHPAYLDLSDAELEKLSAYLVSAR